MTSLLGCSCELNIHSHQYVLHDSEHQSAVHQDLSERDRDQTVHKIQEFFNGAKLVAKEPSYEFLVAIYRSL